MLLIFLLVGAPGRAFAMGSCERLFRHQELPFQNEIEIKQQLKQLVPRSGSGLAEFSIEGFFSKSWIESLQRFLPTYKNPEFHGYIPLYSHGKKSPAAGAIDRTLTAPIFDYANSILAQLNDSLPGKEHGQMEIQAIRIVYSDGTLPQATANWHMDSFDYLTFVTNLDGAGTLIDVSPAKPRSGKKFIHFPDPSEILNLQPGRAAMLNSWVRHLLVAGRGAYPILHRAPDGEKGQTRLGIVIWYKPKGLNGTRAYDYWRAKTIEAKKRILDELRNVFGGLRSTPFAADKMVEDSFQFSKGASN